MERKVLLAAAGLFVLWGSAVAEQHTTPSGDEQTLLSGIDAILDIEYETVDLGSELDMSLAGLDLKQPKEPSVTAGYDPYYAEILLVLDDTFIDQFGEDAESVAADVFDHAASYFQDPSSEMFLQLELSGIISYPQGLPAGITVIDAGNGEVNTVELLNSFSQWQSTNRPDIETMLGTSYDAAILLCGLDLDNYSGLSWFGTMCHNHFGTSVMEFDSSTGFTGAILAHNIGHNLDMTHATTGIMMAGMGPSSYPTSFSSTSISEWQTWMAEGHGACLSNVPSGPGWEAPRCGDGRVGGVETCDAGIDLFDGSCCDPQNCALEPGCNCANYNACCESGSVLTAGTLCREATGDCDVAEVCDGFSGECPLNLGRPQGESCTSVDGFDGSCHNTECVSIGQICYDRFGTDECLNNPDSNCDGTVRCSYYSYPSYTCYYYIPIPHGQLVGCEPGYQCYEGECTDSSIIGPFYWVVGRWSECADNMQLRDVTCIDVAGTIVDGVYCGVSSEPPSIQFCTPVTLADFAVMQRCINLPATGECAAMDYTGDNYVDLSDYLLFTDLLVGS